MIKPEWDEAPEWAKWLAQDYLGGWWWFESKPKWCNSARWWESTYHSKSEAVHLMWNPNAHETLEERP